MGTESKQLLKKVIRRIHPDLFGSDEQKRTTNTDALAVGLSTSTYLV